MGGEDTPPLIEELALKQSGRLRQFLRKRVRNAADIPDIIQEVFLRLLRVPRHETIRQPEAYIFTIARHAAQQHMLRSARPDNFVDLDEALEDFLTGSEGDPVLEVGAEQCIAGLEESLQRMSQDARHLPLISQGRIVDGRGQRTPGHFQADGEEIPGESPGSIP